MKPKANPNPKSKKEVTFSHIKKHDINRSKKCKRIVRSFHPDTLSIPSDETIGVLQGTVTYTEVIDAVTGDSLGVPNMDVVRKTMRPAKSHESRDGEYYIANFRTPEEQEEYDHKLAAEPFSWK